MEVNENEKLLQKRQVLDFENEKIKKEEGNELSKKQQEEDLNFPLSFYESHKYYLFNKPIGYLSTREKDENTDTLYTLAKSLGVDNEDLGIVGRLDKETSGIIILTNDGRLNRILTYPDEENEIKRCKYKEKEYNLVVTSYFLNQMNFEKLEEEMSEPFSFSRNNTIKSTSKSKIKFLKYWQDIESSKGRPELGWRLEILVVINEGKHHQVRRIAQRAKLQVLTLTRIKIASILDIQSIPKEKYFRIIEYNEIKEIYCGLGITYNQNYIYGKYYK